MKKINYKVGMIAFGIITLLWVVVNICDCSSGLHISIKHIVPAIGFGIVTLLHLIFFIKEQKK